MHSKNTLTVNRLKVAKPSNRSLKRRIAKGANKYGIAFVNGLPPKHLINKLYDNTTIRTEI